MEAVTLAKLTERSSGRMIVNTKLCGKEFHTRHVFHFHSFICQLFRTKVHPETGSLEVPTGPTSFEVPVNLPGSVHSVLVHDATDAKDKNKSKGPVDPGGKVCTVVVANDLPAALEIKFAEEAKVLYPKRYHKFRTAVTRDSVMQICLRDNPKISGSCQVSGALTLHASKSFGSFGVEARHFLENEKKQVQRERCLLLDRKKQMEKELAIDVSTSFGTFHSLFCARCSASDFSHFASLLSLRVRSLLWA